jgi:hypothetical protein
VYLYNVTLVLRQPEYAAYLAACLRGPTAWKAGATTTAALLANVTTLTPANRNLFAPRPSDSSLLSGFMLSHLAAHGVIGANVRVEPDQPLPACAALPDAPHIFPGLGCPGGDSGGDSADQGSGGSSGTSKGVKLGVGIGVGVGGGLLCIAAAVAGVLYAKRRREPPPQPPSSTPGHHSYLDAAGKCGPSKATGHASHGSNGTSGQGSNSKDSPSNDSGEWRGSRVAAPERCGTLLVCPAWHSV